MANTIGMISNEMLDEMTEAERQKLERAAGCKFVKYDVNSAHDINNVEALKSAKGKNSSIMNENFDMFTKAELKKVYSQYNPDETDLQKVVELNSKLFMIKVNYALKFWSKANLINATMATWAGAQQKGNSYFTSEADPDHAEEVAEYQEILKDCNFDAKPDKALRQIATAACKIEEARMKWRLKLLNAGRKLNPAFVWATK